MSTSVLHGENTVYAFAFQVKIVQNSIDYRFNLIKS
jgi:hypothetical protein